MMIYIYDIQILNHTIVLLNIPQIYTYPSNYRHMVDIICYKITVMYV